MEKSIFHTLSCNVVGSCRKVVNKMKNEAYNLHSNFAFHLEFRFSKEIKIIPIDINYYDVKFKKSVENHTYYSICIIISVNSTQATTLVYWAAGGSRTYN